jgi:hypothetical protein
VETIGGPEVLDHGRERGTRRWTGPLGLIVALALVAVAGGAAITAWLNRPPTSPALEVTRLEITGDRPVTVVAEPPVGALSAPAGTALPGVTVRVSLGGDPRRAVEVVASTTEALAYVEAIEPVAVPAGAFTEIDLTIAPVDCAAARTATDLDEAGYRWRRPFGIDILSTTDGAPVALSTQARADFAAALGRACMDAGDPPRIRVIDGGRGSAPNLESIGLTVDVDAQADRIVVTPLDGPGLRGLGSTDRRTGADIPLLWLVSIFAEHNDDIPLAYTQVYVVRGATAYPWVVAIPITADMLEAPPVGMLTPLRSGLYPDPESEE